MILSDTRILEEIEKKTIIIEPYNRDKLGSNSYDVHLGKYLAIYKDKFLMPKNIMRLIILKYLKKDLFCNLRNYIWALH